MPAGKGHDAHEVRALLDAMHADDPDEPMWRGVVGTAVEGEAVRVDFREPVEPALTPVEDVEVACHLFDGHVAGTLDTA